jgi:hypothetical protein
MSGFWMHNSSLRALIHKWADFTRGSAAISPFAALKIVEVTSPTQSVPASRACEANASKPALPHTFSAIQITRGREDQPPPPRDSQQKNRS